MVISEMRTSDDMTPSIRAEADPPVRRRDRVLDIGDQPALFVFLTKGKRVGGDTVMATGRGITDTKLYDRDAVIDRYGIPPELIPDFYGLKGDTSDNIPGVPGIGDKTAAQICCSASATSRPCWRSIDEISGAKRKENLTNHADDARISKQLATIQRDIPTPTSTRARRSAASPTAPAARRLPRVRAARPLGAWRRSLGDEEAAAPAPRHGETRVKARVREGDARRPRVAARRRRGRGRRASRPRRPRASCSRRTRRSRFARGRTATTCWSGPCDTARGRSSPRSASAPVVAHDAKSLGDVPPNLAHDTLLGAYLLEPARRGFPFRELCEERGFGAERVGPAPPPTPCSSRRSPPGSASSSPTAGCSALMDEIELPLVDILREMEQAGVRLNAERLPTIKRRVDDEIATLEREIWDLAGEEFVHRLAPAARRRSSSRSSGCRASAAARPGFSTDARVLQAIRDEHEVIPKIERWRELNQLSKTYLERPAAASATPRAASTRRSCRPSPRPAGCRRPTRTCRTSRCAPTLGPRDPRLLRGAPTATCSSAPTTRRSSCGSSPTSPASTCSRRSSSAARTCTRRRRRRSSARRPTDLTPMDRSKAKMINYGIVYGLSDYGLADRLNIAREEAKAFIDAYLERFAERRRVHDGDDRAGQGAGLRHDALRPPPADPRAAGAQLPGAHAGRAARGQHGHPGHGGRRAEARDDRRRARCCEGLRTRHDPHDPRRAALRGARGGGRRGARARRARDDRAVGRHEPPLAVDVGAGKTWLEAK